MWCRVHLSIQTRSHVVRLSRPGHMFVCGSCGVFSCVHEFSCVCFHIVYNHIMWCTLWPLALKSAPEIELRSSASRRWSDSFAKDSEGAMTLVEENSQTGSKTSGRSCLRLLFVTVPVISPRLTHDWSPSWSMNRVFLCIIFSSCALGSKLSQMPTCWLVFPCVCDSHIAVRCVDMTGGYESP